MKVLKFGGTSVGSALNMTKVAEIVKSEGAKVTVLSAMSGTTDSLVKIVALCEGGKDNISKVDELLEVLKEKYSTCIAELLKDGESALDKMTKAFDIIKQQALDFKEYTSERVIISQGELLTSAIFTMYMNQIGLKAVLLNAPDFMTTDSEGIVNTERLASELSSLESEGVYYVTQGFISTNHLGQTDNLGRGGSDYSAALIGAAINAEQVQIWTDIDGMHNNDPRVVENTYPIRSMTFDEAAELAYFGAKILHPATIQPCKDKGIAVLLKNTMEPSAAGTTISNVDDNQEQLHAVAAKDKISVIRICSTRMLMAYGFLRRVFEVFEKHKTPIDMIVTSEVSVSVTVDCEAHLDEIMSDLADFGRVQIEKGNNTIVCIVGKLTQEECGLAVKVLDSINTIPVKMISYGASNRSMAILVDTKYKNQTLQKLNDGLFVNKLK
ncbi:MAG: aspartate kinase [Rikenellaceae bacterium]